MVIKYTFPLVPGRLTHIWNPRKSGTTPSFEGHLHSGGTVSLSEWSLPDSLRKPCQ